MKILFYTWLYFIQTNFFPLKVNEDISKAASERTTRDSFKRPALGRVLKPDMFAITHSSFSGHYE
jgi:hypothetical protein